MHVTTLISAAITLIGALVVLRWMPGRPAARAELAEQPEETEHEPTEAVQIPAALRADPVLRADAGAPR